MNKYLEKMAKKENYAPEVAIGAGAAAGAIGLGIHSAKNKYLKKAAMSMTATPTIVKDLIKNKPMTEPLKGFGLKTKKPPMIGAVVDKT